MAKKTIYPETIFFHRISFLGCVNLKYSRHDDSLIIEVAFKQFLICTAV